MVELVFLILGWTSVFLGASDVVSGLDNLLLVELVEGGVIVKGSGEVAPPPPETAAVVEEGAVKVKMTARGRHRRMAQRRERGVGGSMVSRRRE